MGFYKTKKELDLEMGKHRRELLQKVAVLYKQEREEFYQKYRIFQLHKWEILKAVKAKMLEEKLKEVAKVRQMKKWIVMATLRHTLKRQYEKFDRERDMIKIRARMLPILLLIKVGIRKRIRLYGNEYSLRERKYIRNSTTCLFAGCIRPVLRERAKQALLHFMQAQASKAFMVAKFQKFLQRIIVLQRILKLKHKVRDATPFSWQKSGQTQEKKDLVAASKGLCMFIQCVFASNIVRQKEIISAEEEYQEEQYKLLDAIRERGDDKERILSSDFKNSEG